MTQRLVFFYDASSEKMKYLLPAGVVALDCAHERVRDIANRYRLSVPCLVVGERVVSGKTLESWLFERGARPAVVQFFTAVDQDDDDDFQAPPATKTKPETAIEKGKRLASEREQQYGAFASL
jgi:hypothetical protein